MKKLIKPFVSIIGALIFCNAAAQSSQSVKAKIETKNIEGALSIKAVATNLSDVYQSLNYTMLSIKKGKSKNMSSSEQSGKFTLQPKQNREISETSINIGKDDGLKVFLFIRDEKTNKVIAKDSLHVNSKFFANSISESELRKDEDNIVLKGLIINETKSKSGETFYDKLYSFMMLNSVEFPFTLKVTEFPTFGTGTQIQVNADDNAVISFVAKPDDDYLNIAVNETIAKLFAYEENKKVTDTGFMY